MLPLGRSLIGRFCSSLGNAQKRSFATCHRLLDDISSSSENCRYGEFVSSIKNRQVSAQSASLVHAVNRRHRWLDLNGQPNSVLPFIRDEQVTHPSVREEICSVDTMKAHLTTLAAAAAALPRPVPVGPDPQDGMAGQPDTDDTVEEEEEGKTVRRFTIKERQKAVVKALNPLADDTFYDTGTPWTWLEERHLLLSHVKALTDSEYKLKHRARAIIHMRDYQTPAKKERFRAIIKKLYHVRKSREIIMCHLRATVAGGGCAYERERRLMYVTLRLEHEAHAMDKEATSVLDKLRWCHCCLGEAASASSYRCPGG